MALTTYPCEKRLEKRPKASAWMWGMTCLGSTLHVSRRLFSQRLIEGKEIPKTLANSSRGIPRSTASNTFSLRSFEYALMPNGFAEDQLSRKPLLDLKERGGVGALRALSMPPSWCPKEGHSVEKTKRGKGTKLMAIADGTSLTLAVHGASASPHELIVVEETLSELFVEERRKRSRNVRFLN
jgi:hypothetical protein